MKAKLTSLFLLLAAPLLHAQSTPALMSYQGRVTDAAGVLIGNTAPVNRAVIFKLYSAQSGGTALYAETQTVTISGGEFSVLIGNGTGISSLPGPSSPATTPYKTLADIVNSGTYSGLYLGVTVDDGTSAVDPEISPRQQMVSGAFALRAKVAESVAGSAITNTMLGDLSVSTTKIATGAVDGSRILDLTIEAGDIKDNTITAGKLAATVGVWSVVGSSVYRDNNVGIGEANPGFPLNFASSLGDKISLYGNSGAHYGFGIQGGLLQIHTSASGEDVAFGYGRSGSFTETMRIKGNGNVGMGTTTPGDKLVVVGTASADKIISNGMVRARGGNYGANSINTGFSFDSNGDADGGMFSGADGLLQFYTNGSEKVRLTSGGLLGVGTANPAEKLSIQDGKLWFTTATGNGDNGGIGGVMASNDSFRIFGSGSDNDGALYIDTYDDANEPIIFRQVSGQAYERMRIAANGNVGIGTSTPAVKLDVAGSTKITMSDNYYAGNNTTYNSSNVTHTSTDVTGGGGIEVYSEDGTGAFSKDRKFETSVSIRADGWIVTAKGFAAYSDRRIKRDARASSPADDLAAIQQLKVTEYRMVDPDDGDASWRKGFIAQEVKAVIPGAVSQSVNFVPDIFAPAETAEHDAAKQVLTVKLAKEHGLKAGQRVRLHIDGNRKDFIVGKVLSAFEFAVDDCETAPGKVFVYGSEVSDFSTLDYDRIYTTSVGAIQELARKIEAGESENAALKTRQVNLEARLSALEKLTVGN